MRQSSPLGSSSRSPSLEADNIAITSSSPCGSPMHTHSNFDASSSDSMSSWSSPSPGNSPTDSSEGYDEHFSGHEFSRDEEDSHDRGGRAMHTPPLSPSGNLSSPSTKSTIPAPPSKSIHPYPRPPTSQQHSTLPSIASRPVRPRGLAPLSTLPSLPQSNNAHGHLPKSQPLSRALFARMASDTPHAGQVGGAKKKGGSPKLIVPSKGFRTTFELGLSASELARKA